MIQLSSMKKATVSPIITLQGALLAKFYEDSLAMHLKNENNIHLNPLTTPSLSNNAEDCCTIYPPLYAVLHRTNMCEPTLVPSFHPSYLHNIPCTKKTRNKTHDASVFPFKTPRLRLPTHHATRTVGPNPILGKCPALLTKSQKYTHNSKQH
jgi:hypothetical protein